MEINIITEDSFIYREELILLFPVTMFQIIVYIIQIDVSYCTVRRNVKRI